MMQGNNNDADYWFMHEEEQVNRKQLQAILNKLTPQNFDLLVNQLKIDDPASLNAVISQIFDRAQLDHKFSEVYAKLCSHLCSLPDFSEDSEKINFKSLLVSKCEEEFERGGRRFGTIKLIGELYKKKIVTERSMHEAIKKLFSSYNNPVEEDVEALCKLMSTIGEMIDHPKVKEYMDAYFELIANLSNNMKISARVRFMLKDVIDLRKNEWKHRREVEVPMKIDELHRNARNVVNGPLRDSWYGHGRGFGLPSMVMNNPPDYAPKVMLSMRSQLSPSGLLPPRVRGFSGFGLGNTS